MTPPLIRSFLAALTLASVGLPSAFAQTTERVSVDSSGGQGNSFSPHTSISADGRYVAFQSWATNLIPGDTNGMADIFVHDRQTDQTSRVSVGSTGVQGNWNCWETAISAGGRYVAFGSQSTNLVPGDTNGGEDVFVHDRHTGQTSRVSVDSAGVQGDSSSHTPCISADGRYVAFYSYATNLVPSDTNGWVDVFVHDRQTGQTSRASVDSAGGQGNSDSFTHYSSISADGRLVVFHSWATNLVPGDTNGKTDAFVHDRQTGLTSRVSVDSAGGQGNEHSAWPSISADGRTVAFHSWAANLVPSDTNGDLDVFVHDRQTSQTARVSVDSAGGQGNNESFSPFISADSRYVTFHSRATNLVPGDTNGYLDVFVYDRQTGQTSRVSVDSAGSQGNNESGAPFISADGRYVAFTSEATNLVPGDTNSSKDVFVRDRGVIGPSLSMSGTCPGIVTLTISNATFNSAVAIVYGPAGVFLKPTPPCQGLTLGVSPPSLGAVRTADAAGVAVLNFNAPPGACGRSVQAVDVTTCTASNVIVL